VADTFYVGTAVFEPVFDFVDFVVVNDASLLLFDVFGDMSVRLHDRFGVVGVGHIGVVGLLHVEVEGS